MATALFSLTDWQFWGFTCLQIAFVLIVLRGLGWIILHKLQFQATSFFQSASWHSVLIFVGLAFFTLTAWALGELGQRHLQWFVILLGCLGTVLEFLQRRRNKKAEKLHFKLNINDKMLGIAILFGVALQLIAIVTSGIRVGDTADFYFTNAGDGMMHLAFSRSLIATYPPVRPELANIPLTNYHFFTDLLMAEQSRLLQIPIAHSFFQFWPVLLALGSAILIISIVQQFSKSVSITWISLFFWFFNGELGYLFSLLIHHTFNWNVATIENSADQFLNMPQMFAKTLVFAVYWLGLYWYKNLKMKTDQNIFLAIVLLIAAATGYKIYFGLFTLALVIGLWLAQLLTNLQSKTALAHLQILGRQFFWLLVGCLFVVMILRSVSTGSGKLGWYPLVWPKLLISSEHLDLKDLANRLQINEYAGNTPKIVLFNSLVLLIGLLALFGTKLVGMWYFVQSKTLNWYRAVLLSALVSAGIIGLNTLQDPGGFNTYNFLLVAMQPLFFLTVLVLDQLWQQKKIHTKVIVVAILLLGSVRPIANYHKYFSAITHHRVEAAYSTSELLALDWIANNTPVDTLVQASPQSGKSRQNSYISFFAKRPTYLALESIAQSHGITTKQKRIALESAVSVSNYELLAANMRQLGINYLYVEHESSQTKILDLLGITEHTVFTNDAATIVVFN